MLRISPLLILLSLPWLGCGDAEPEAVPGTIYDSRAQVVSLPGESAVESALYLHHEAIDEFRDLDGEIVGMPSMTMPFPVASEVDLSEVEIGDKVSFSFEVRWEGDPPYQVLRIEALPPQTELQLTGR
ncbi:MAG: copper-binding protein [Acidobacteriota bacterium]